VKVLLKECCDVDLKTYPIAPTRWVKVFSFEEASKKCRNYIDKYEIGSSSWCGGEVKDDSGKSIGIVGYNGSTWTIKEHLAKFGLIRKT
jgi:hypothetical protein